MIKYVGKRAKNQFSNIFEKYLLKILNGTFIFYWRLFSFVREFSKLNLFILYLCPSDFNMKLTFPEGWGLALPLINNGLPIAQRG